MPAPAKLNLVQTAENTLTVALTGSWKLTEQLPSAEEVQQALGAAPNISRVAFDARQLTGWDSGLLIFLTQLNDLCTQRKIAIEAGGLPEGTSKMLALAAAVPEKKDARRAEGRVGFLTHVGSETVDFFRSLGEILAFIGDTVIAFLKLLRGSGCGKSTMMTTLIGLKSPAKGQVLYGELDFWNADQPTRDRLIRRAGVMYQSGALWSSMTLAENIALPLETYTDLSSARIREIVKLKLALVGMAGFEEFYPSEISGGMQKRAGIARAMALDPEILFFDEPSAGLDPVSARRLDDLILELRDSLGTTMVVVTHEFASIFIIGNNSVFLDAAKRTMTATGDRKRLLAETWDPVLRQFLTRGEES